MWRLALLTSQPITCEHLSLPPMSSASHQSSPAIRRPVTISDHSSYSSSTDHGLQPWPPLRLQASPYMTDRLSAFADVNKALGARAARQSVADKARPPARMPQMPAPEPNQPRTLKKPQPSNARPTHVADANHPMMAAREHYNPRFSTASAPAYTQSPAMPAQYESHPHGSYRRASESDEHMASNRPALRVIIPSTSQPSGRVHGAQKATTFADLGHKPAPLKDHSGCVIM